MRFIYYYKTSDNVRHEAEMSASSRDEVFAVLREKGIRPIKVVAEEDEANVDRGFKGDKGGKGLRGVGALVLAAGMALGVAVWLMVRRSGNVTHQPQPQPAKRGVVRYDVESNVVQVRTDGARVAQPRPRRFMPEFAHGMTATNSLKRASERLLAFFAMPGEPLPDNLPPVDDTLTEDFYESLGEDILVEADDSVAVAELKGIVARLKNEAEVYLRTGRGLTDYIDYLRQRQRMEVRYRQEIMRDYSGEEAAGMLRSMGFRPEDVQGR